MVGLGAAGLVTAPYLQSGFEAFLGAASDKDPTGLTGLLPNGGGFRYYSVASSVSERRPEDYRLTVDGLVDHPVTYTLDELRRLPQTRVVRDVQCVTGWRVPGTPFEGSRCHGCSTPPGCDPKPGPSASAVSTARTPRA